MPLPIASRLLIAWKRTQTTHRHITAVQFLVLCHIVETAAQNVFPSTTHRSRALGISQNSIAVAQRTLEALGLIQLTALPPSRRNPRPFAPHLAARPTRAALKLFTHRRGRKPSTPSHP